MSNKFPCDEVVRDISWLEVWTINKFLFLIKKFLKVNDKYMFLFKELFLNLNTCNKSCIHPQKAFQPCWWTEKAFQHLSNEKQNFYCTFWLLMWRHLEGIIIYMVNVFHASRVSYAWNMSWIKTLHVNCEVLACWFLYVFIFCFICFY